MIAAPPASVDVLVVGAGVAGLAAAERLLREGEERGRVPRVAVVEAAQEIGTGASSGLQGWFHSGALYATLANPDSMGQCIRSEQLLAGMVSGLKLSKPSRRWLGAKLTYVIDRSLADTVGATIAGLSGEAATDAPFCASREPYCTVRTRDRQLCTRSVLADLRDSIAGRGGSVLCGWTLAEWRDGHARFVPTCDAGPDADAETPATPMHISFGRMVITAGCEIGRFDARHTARFSRRTGIIVSVTPALEAPNLVRIAADKTKNISCILHERAAGTFSAVGDSTSLPADADEASCERVAHAIRDKIVDLLGERALVGRRLAWHACSKIEAVDTADGEPAFRPAVWSLDPDRRVVAAIPSKFSLFPLLAEHIVDEAIAHGWFDAVGEAGADREPARPLPAIAPTRSEAALGLSGAAAAGFLHGRVESRDAAAVSDEQAADPPIVHTTARLRARWSSADGSRSGIR
ncbi:MAG: FAD-dependent oxidoreductase [Planctomycetota bacterium]